MQPVNTYTKNKTCRLQVKITPEDNLELERLQEIAERKATPKSRLIINEIHTMIKEFKKSK